MSVLMGVAEEFKLGFIGFLLVKPGLAEVGDQGLGPLSQEADIPLGVAVTAVDGQDHMIGQLDAISDFKPSAAIIILSLELLLVVFAFLNFLQNAVH